MGKGKQKTQRINKQEERVRSDADRRMKVEAARVGGVIATRICAMTEYP